MPTINVMGRDACFSDQGSGPVVLCLHGSMSTSGAWRPIAANLGNDHRIVAVDLWGYGKSARWEEDWPIDNSMECALVEALARSVGEPVHLAGHSHGGTLALAHAMRGKMDIASLISVEATPFALLKTGGETALFAELRAAFDAYFAATETGEPSPVRRVIDYWDGAGTYDTLPEQVQEFLSRAVPMNIINVNVGFAFDPPLESPLWRHWLPSSSWNGRLAACRGSTTITTPAPSMQSVTYDVRPSRDFSRMSSCGSRR